MNLFDAEIIAGPCFIKACVILYFLIYSLRVKITVIAVCCDGALFYKKNIRVVSRNAYLTILVTNYVPKY